MIRQLMREQARAQRGYVAWTGAFIAATVALVTFVGVIALQQFSVVAHAERVFGLDGAWSRSIELGADYEALGPAPTLAELGAKLDAADAEGAVTAALHELPGLGLRLPGAHEFAEAGFPAARMAAEPAGVRGAVDWDALLATGRAPGRGEVALDAEWAAALGLGVGDTVAAVWRDDETDDEWHEVASLTVSGLTHASSQGRYGARLPLALLDWGQSFELGDREHVEVSAQRETPALEGVVGWPGSPDFEADTEVARWTVLGLTAAVLAVGVIGMAFAAGRAQAQARTRWIATARVLGARRSAIAAATVAEALASGVLAGAAGLGHGWAAGRLDWATFAVASPGALLPPAPGMPGWVAAAAIALALVLAGIVGGVPAFWAARVAPAAALAPVTPITSSPRRPRIPALWLHLAWATAMVACSLTIQHETYGGYEGFPFSIALVSVAALLSCAVLARWVRHATTVAGRRLARSSRPWALSSSIVLRGRPRQASAPASVLALATATLVAFQAGSALHAWANQGRWIADPRLAEESWFPEALLYPRPDGALAEVAVLTLGVLAIVALATHLATARAHQDDDAAQGALGLTRRDTRLAHAAVAGLPLTLGVALGTAMGLVVAVASFAGWEYDPDFTGPGEIPRTAAGPVWALAHLGHLAIPVAEIAMIGLTCAAIAAGLAAVLGPVGTRGRTRT